jgi:hypothetical protein
MISGCRYSASAKPKQIYLRSSRRLPQVKKSSSSEALNRWVRLVPFGVVKRNRRPGALKGKLVVGARFFEPLPENELFHE